MESPFPLYDETLRVLASNPNAIIRQERTEQVVALKLQLPDIIRGQRKMRNDEYQKFDQCMRDIDSLKKTIELAVKSEREPGSNKLKFNNKELRAVEIQHRLEADPVYIQRERMRRNMYAQVKNHDIELDYLERMDHSLIEIMALLTATLEYITTHKGAPHGKRSTHRAAKRADTAAMAGRSGGLAEDLTRGDFEASSHAQRAEQSDL